jgi:hypothetical protein
LEIEGFEIEGLEMLGFEMLGFEMLGFEMLGFEMLGFEIEGFEIEGFEMLGLEIEGFEIEGFEMLGFAIDGACVSDPGTGLVVAATSWSRGTLGSALRTRKLERPPETVSPPGPVISATSTRIEAAGSADAAKTV